MTMQDKPNDILLLAGKVLTVLTQAIMAIAAIALPIGAVVLAIVSGDIPAEIASETGQDVGPFPLLATLALMAVAFAVVALVFVFFGKLRAIIATVGEGDPFAPANADRLSFMAWLLLAVQGLTLLAIPLAIPLATWTEQFDDASFTVDGGLDLTGIMMVVVLFILARVFKHGAAMREDLEGTV